MYFYVVVYYMLLPSTPRVDMMLVDDLNVSFSFVSLIELTTRWVFINSHFITKTATVFINKNKRETTNDDQPRS